MLEADRDARRRNDDPTGEVESLWGKMDGKKMGDRAAGGGLVITKSTELDDKIKKSRTKRDKRERTELEDEKRRNKSSKVAMAGKGSTVCRDGRPRRHARRCARSHATRAGLGSLRSNRSWGRRRRVSPRSLVWRGRATTVCARWPRATAVGREIDDNDRIRRATVNPHRDDPLLAISSRRVASTRL